MNSRSSVSLRRCLLQKPRPSMRHAIAGALLGMICAVIVAEYTPGSTQFKNYWLSSSRWKIGAPRIPLDSCVQLQLLPGQMALLQIIFLHCGIFDPSSILADGVASVSSLICIISFHEIAYIPITSNMHCQSMLATLLLLWNLPSPGVSLGLQWCFTQWCFTGHLSWGWCHQVKGHASSTSRHSIHRTSIDVWIS